MRMMRAWMGVLGVLGALGVSPGVAAAQTAPDTTAPTITIVSPVEGAAYAQGSPVTASFNCTDDTDPAVASCVGTVADGASLDTSAPGPATFTVTARDAAGNESVVTRHYDIVVQDPGDVGGPAPATLDLTLGSSTPFSPFIPGFRKDYTAVLPARVVSTAEDATLTVADPSATAPGHLVNGAYVMPQALQAAATSTTGVSAPTATLGSAPQPLLTWGGPAGDDVTVTFTQPIGANDALRTGGYAKTLTFTLSTTNP
jgi:Bacterial Ig domain